MAVPKLRVLVTALALSASGLAGIAAHEGLRNHSYLDTGKVWTVCHGHTKTAAPGQYRDTGTCKRLLANDVKDAERAVQRRVTIPITSEQYDELVDFTFNVGETQFANSTLLKRLNSGDCWGAAAQFDRWVYDNGKKQPGLVARRADNRKGFERGCVWWQHLSM